MQARQTEEGPRLGAAGRPRRPGHETSRLGEEIYERDFRPLVEADHVGKFVAIDVDTGSWAMGEDIIAASDLLRAQHPDAKDVWLERVGHMALASFGGQPTLLERPEGAAR